MSEPKTFPVGDVLSVTTGILVGPSHVDGIYAIVDHMEQRPHWTHELPDASNRVRESILRQVPELAEAYPPELSGEDECNEWVAKVCAHIGRTEVALLPCSDEMLAALPPVNPLRTLQEKIGGA